uniref:Uncharacterized protein n=1 Tax=Esox lucius TaxID=8010 RepID=A0A6Q2Y894_ESOLU
MSTKPLVLNSVLMWVWMLGAKLLSGELQQLNMPLVNVLPLRSQCIPQRNEHLRERSSSTGNPKKEGGTATPPFPKYCFQRPLLSSKHPVGGGTAPVEKHWSSLLVNVKSAKSLETQMNRSKSLCDKEESRSKSLSDKEESRSKSLCDKEESRSKSLCDKEESRSKSLCDKEESRSKSPCDTVESRSKSLCDKQESRLKSLCDTVESRSKSLCDKQESRSKSLCDKEESRSKSFCDKQESSSKSLCDTVESRSKSLCDKQESSLCDKQESSSKSLCDTVESRSKSLCDTVESRSKSLCDTVESRSKSLCDTVESRSKSLCDTVESRSKSLCDTVESRSKSLCDTVESRLKSLCDTVESRSKSWESDMTTPRINKASRCLFSTFALFFQVQLQLVNHEKIIDQRERFNSTYRPFSQTTRDQEFVKGLGVENRTRRSYRCSPNSQQSPDKIKSLSYGGILFNSHGEACQKCISQGSSSHATNSRGESLLSGQHGEIGPNLGADMGAVFGLEVVHSECLHPYNNLLTICNRIMSSLNLH